MRKINSYMNKLGLDAGDIVKLGKNDLFVVNNDGYLNKNGKVDFIATMAVLFGLEEYELPKVNTINYQDYMILELAKSWGYKRIVVGVKNEIYITRLSRGQFRNYIKGIAINELDKKIPRFGIDGVKPTCRIPADLKSEFINELIIGKQYSINFLIRRYKNRVLK